MKLYHASRVPGIKELTISKSNNKNVKNPSVYATDFRDYALGFGAPWIDPMGIDLSSYGNGPKILTLPENWVEHFSQPFSLYEVDPTGFERVPGTKYEYAAPSGKVTNEIRYKSLLDEIIKSKMKLNIVSKLDFDLDTQKEIERYLQQMGHIKSSSSKPTAVIIKGNDKLIHDSAGVIRPEAKKFYERIKTLIESQGYNVEIDPGADFTTPRKDKDVLAWIGHSKGGGRLKYAPRHISPIGIGVSERLKDLATLINHPDDLSVHNQAGQALKENKDLNMGDIVGRKDKSYYAHYDITPEGELKLTKHLKQLLNNTSYGSSFLKKEARDRGLGNAIRAGVALTDSMNPRKNEIISGDIPKSYMDRLYSPEMIIKNYTMGGGMGGGLMGALGGGALGAASADPKDEKQIALRALLGGGAGLLAGGLSGAGLGNMLGNYYWGDYVGK